MLQASRLKSRLHEHQVPNPDSNLDHNLHGRGGLSPDLNPVCLRVNTTSLDQDLDQNTRVNGALEHAQQGLVGGELSPPPQTLQRP